MTILKRMSFTVLATFLLAAWTQTTALADPFEDGKAAYDDADYEAAVKMWQPLADQGDAKAQLWIGNMYEQGLGGVKQDYTEALKWHRKAADQGNGRALNDVANYYMEGRGGAVDYAEALKWYQKSADQGYVLGQYSIGEIYAKGLGVKQDYAEAMKWYQKAADQGLANAKAKLKALHNNTPEPGYIQLGSAPLNDL